MAENNVLNPRQAAYRSLLKCTEYNKYSNLEVSATIDTKRFSDGDKRLYTLLVYGVIERLVTLDYIISKLSSRPVGKIDKETLCCLRLGLFQLKYTDKIPDHAAVSETVALAKRSSKGFVNAVLREFIRTKKSIPLPDDTFSDKYLSVKYSCPERLCGFLVQKIGRDKTEKVLESFLLPRGVDIRVNTLITTAEELLTDTFPDGRLNLLTENIITVPRVCSEGVKDGKWFVQDAASCLAAQALGALPGDTVADVCAAPGGKSFSVAIDMKNTGKVYSFDLHENKISLIKKGAERLGITIIEAACHDASNPCGHLVGKVDRVLCDAPCSGLGVIGKKPDIKYKSVDDIQRLPEVQKRVLKGASAYVKPGGILVYSTCTLNPDENENVVFSFLEENGDFEAVPVGAAGFELPMKTFYPHIDGTDGFFIAKMRRKN